MLTPFRMLYPSAALAADVAAPPFDVVTVAEARRIAEGNPYCFLRVSRAELELTDAAAAESAASIDPAVYRRGADNLQRMIGDGVLRQAKRPQYGVYRLSAGDHRQTGLVGLASLPDYRDGSVLTHERTVPERVADRAALIAAHRSHSGLVLAFADFPTDLLALTDTLAAAPPFAALEADDVLHEVWLVEDEDTVARMAAACDALPAIYIADGHHRSAAAMSAWADRDYQPPDGFPVALFPSDQVTTLSYNRVLTSLGDGDVEQLLQAIAEHYSIGHRPQPAGETPQYGFDFYTGTRWQRATPISAPPLDDDGVPMHAVSLLRERVLGPVLGVDDERSDPRVEFVGGDVSPSALAARFAVGDIAAAFWMAPTPVPYLRQVADRRGVMPAKSTWFSPKVRDGLFVHSL